MRLGREEGFRAGFSNALFDELGSPALMLRSPRVRELATANALTSPIVARVRGGLTIAPGADSLLIETWKNSEEDVDRLRARIVEECRGRVRQPSATDASTEVP